MEIPQWLSRTQLLIGEESITTLNKRHVLVVGLGGVGGICAEMIARSGVGELTLVDGDVIEASNRNRQIAALVSTNEQEKTTVMKARLLDINPDLKVNLLTAFVNEKEIQQLFAANIFDYVVDCIDTLSPKVALLNHCYNHRINCVSSMGAGGRLDPSQVVIADISKTYNCKLAYYVRKRLHQRGIYKGIQTVFSTEQPDFNKVRLAPSGPKKSVIGTISYMPTIFGCTLASVAIRGLMNLK